ncbi:hypothetical protein GCE86_06690 [Micromonospora terminaliae]|uniref:Ribbon-helix-helix protein, CopG family n=1 Tax=Micromonospora terminaliae TaxID=1914461 RepID=A0AAJ3DKN6_9ACTN|nr:hypothetical protein [Micromonospora terminaliae]NES30064.1 hypothetical protein [Micromonospora terminaliae]QGL46763.1 hypothetical protein GCE86_06690 [Micromonospora terminaliae]
MPVDERMIMPSSTITVRLPDEVRQRLDEEARRLRVPPGTLAARLVAEGVDDPPPALAGDAEPPVSALEASVLASFAGTSGPLVGVQRELALTLARQAEQGGSGAAGAAARLRDVLAQAHAHTPPDVDALAALLATPVVTECPQCGFACGAGVAFGV